MLSKPIFQLYQVYSISEERVMAAFIHDMVIERFLLPAL